MRKIASQARSYFSVVVLLGLLALPVGLKCQVNMASLSGTVSDPSGSAIPGVQVTLSSTTREARQVTATDSVGLYVIPTILPGSYQLTVAAGGFTTKTIENINLSAGQGSTLNISMEVGSAITKMTVSVHAPLLETTTASLGGALATSSVTALPINGRNFSDLLPTLPGASTPGLTYQVVNFAPAGGTGLDTSFFGQKPRDNEFMLDGVPDAEFLFNGVPIYPPPEAIGEMKVETGMDSGAYGWAAGANIAVVTKTGTNAYHGELWDYLQNNALNARSFFTPTVPVTRLNQFGAAAGGPLVIPHILSKNKGWYIFGWYEGIRNPTSSSAYQLVPTAAEKNGKLTDDSAVIYNPYTSVVATNGTLVSRSPFANKIIPSGATDVCSPNPTCLDPNATLIINALSPLPNLTVPGPGATNYLNTTRGAYNTFNWSARVDHQFGTHDGFYARLSDSRIISSATSSFSGYGVSNTYYRLENLVASDTHTFSNSFLLTGRFGWNRINALSWINQPEVADPTGLGASWQNSFQGIHIIPGMTITGYPGYNQKYSIQGPEDLYTYSVDVQKIYGKHLIQLGAMYIHDQFIITSGGASGNTESFDRIPTAGTASGTGNALASFVLGLPSSAQRIVGSAEAHMFSNYPSFYGQDTWHATRKLTVNMGVRFDPQVTMHNILGSGTFVWETGQYIYDRKNPITGAPPNAPTGLVPSDWNNVAPRFGISYSIDPKTVVRASYGIYYDVLGETAQDQQGNRGSWPFSNPQNLSGLNTGLPSAEFANPFPTSGVSTTPLGCGQCLEVGYGATRTPQVQEWNLSVQRQLTPSLMLQTAYFGSHGIHMSSQILDNTALTPGTNSYKLRQRWPQFPLYVNNGYNGFPSFYDGLSVEVKKTYSKSVSFMANYTWSHTLDVADSVNTVNGSAIMPTRFDEKLLYGSAGYNVSQRFVVSYVWNVPARSGNRLLNAVIGNWKYSGVVTLTSGLPFFVIYSADNANLGSVTGRSTDFPNLVANPVLSNPTQTKWFSTSAYQEVPFGTQGNAGKHALYSQPFQGFDCSLSKGWVFKERYGFDLRSDFFNTFNLHDWSTPNYVFDSGPTHFGTITNTQQGGRAIQFGLHFHF